MFFSPSFSLFSLFSLFFLNDIHHHHHKKRKKKKGPGSTKKEKAEMVPFPAKKGESTQSQQSTPLEKGALLLGSTFDSVVLLKIA